MKKRKRRSDKQAENEQLNTKSTDEPGNKDVSIPWSKPARVACSLLLIFHLAAVFAAPFSAPPPSSLLGQQTGIVFEPYLRALCLYNGYRFFAPNPGPSHLVRYELETETGEKIEGTFPDRTEHWPRLLYHRYLMLAETLYNTSTLPSSEDFKVQQLELEVEISRLRAGKHFELAQRLESIKAQDLVTYNKQVQRKQELIEAIANELSHRYDAESIRLYLVEHEIPGARQFEETLGNRQNQNENSESRTQPILTVDQSLYVEFQIYPFDEAKTATPQRRSNPSASLIPPATPELEEVGP